MNKIFEYIKNFFTKRKPNLNQSYEHPARSYFAATIGDVKDIHNEFLVSVKEEDTVNLKKYTFIYESVIKNSVDVVYTYFLKNKGITLPVCIKLFDREGNVYRMITFDTNQITCKNLLNLDYNILHNNRIEVSVLVDPKHIIELN